MAGKKTKGVTPGTFHISDEGGTPSGTETLTETGAFGSRVPKTQAELRADPPEEAPPLVVVRNRNGGEHAVTVEYARYLLTLMENEPGTDRLRPAYIVVQGREHVLDMLNS